MSGVDFVIPMVFEDDPMWQSDFLCHTRHSYHANAYYASRWRSWGTEQLLVKAIRRFMPWVGTIHILLARESQVRDWMKKEDVHIVFHRDYIPEEFLPTFNSNTIEVFLNRIPGLSERFIYGNDDVYPLSPLSEDDFFHDGLPCQRYVKSDYPKDPNVFQQMCLNGLNMIAKDFGYSFTDKWLMGGHSLSPILKSVCDKVWEMHGEEILAGITRERKGWNHNQYIFTFYQHFSKLYVDKIPPRVMLSVSDTIKKITETIGRENVGVVCINDHSTEFDYFEYKRSVGEALRQKIEN